jgi:hypothetical protein
MQWEQIENNWLVYRFIIKQHWDEISLQQLNNIAGERARFSSTIQSTYDVSSAYAEQEISDWQDKQINIDGHFYTAFAAQPFVKNTF